MLTEIVFIIAVAFAILGSSFVAFSKSIVYSAVGLLFALIGVAALYVFLSADFVAVSQLLIYVGGVVVLILFAIMLTQGVGEITISNPAFKKITALIIAGIFFAITLYAIQESSFTLEGGNYKPTVKEIGNMLFKDYLLPFEFASVVIVAVIIGAAVTVRKELVVKKDSKQKTIENSGIEKQ